MKGQVLERRLDLLRLEGNGLSPSEIVKELSQKYGISERSVYYDFETKNVWQPVFHEARRTFLTVVNKHNELYGKASLTYLQTESIREKIFALHLMRTLNRDMFDFLPRADKVVVWSQKTEADARAR